MICEICSDGNNVIEPARHVYIYDPDGLDRQHPYCEKHFNEFCKMVAEEQ